MTPPVLPHRWVVELTTPEDRQAVDELQLEGKVGKALTDKSESQSTIDLINNRANQIRNPSSSRAQP